MKEDSCKMNIKLLIDGGSMKPGPAIAQQLGPLGINMGKVISDVNSATSNFKGMKVPVELNINEKTKSFTIKTFSPPTSELLKKEINLEKGTADHKKVKVGNASIEEIIKVTKIKFPDMLQREFKSAVKSVLGTCKSIGILVENQEANDISKDVEAGKFDSEIKSQKTETSPEKRKELNDYFDSLKKKQEAQIAAEKAAAEEAEKAAAATAAPAAAGKEAAAPAAAATTSAATPAAAKAAPAAKAEDKKAKK
jgi:large subunit ribosomal protein L11